MDAIEQLKHKVSRLLTQFTPGQTEPLLEQLDVYKISQEQFRDGLLLLEADAAEKIDNKRRTFWRTHQTVQQLRK